MATKGVSARARAAADPSAGSRPRRVAFTAWAAVLTIIVGLMFVGTTLLTLGVWLADPSAAETNPVVDLGFFALGGLLVGSGLASQLVRADPRVGGLEQALIGLAALAVAGLLGERVEPLLGGLVLLVAVVVLGVLHPARAELFRLGRPTVLSLAVLVVLAAGPAVIYAVSMLDLAREAGPSCFLGQCAGGDRFAEMAALTIAILGTGILAGAKPRGWRLNAWCVGMAAATVGLASVALPEVPGAVGRLWGILAIAWGIAFVAAAEVERHRPRGFA